MLCASCVNKMPNGYRRFWKQSKSGLCGSGAFAIVLSHREGASHETTFDRASGADAWGLHLHDVAGREAGRNLQATDKVRAYPGAKRAGPSADHRITEGPRVGKVQRCILRVQVEHDPAAATGMRDGQRPELVRGIYRLLRGM